MESQPHKGSARRGTVFIITHQHKNFEEVCHMENGALSRDLWVMGRRVYSNQPEKTAAAGWPLAKIEQNNTIYWLPSLALAYILMFYK